MSKETNNPSIQLNFSLGEVRVTAAVAGPEDVAMVVETAARADAALYAARQRDPAALSTSSQAADRG